MRRLIPAAAALCATASCAHAVGFKTQFNCASDYYSYCSQHSVGTPELRKCMRDNGPRLSKACINALIEDGEVSRAEVEREKERLVAAKSKPKAAEAKKADVIAAKRPEPAKAVAKKAVVNLAKAKSPTLQAPQKPTHLEPKIEPKIARAMPAAATLPAAPVMVAPVKRTAPAIEPPVIEPPLIEAPVIEPPAIETVSLDEPTFEALKNRGSQFVAEDEFAGSATAQPDVSAPRPRETEVPKQPKRAIAAAETPEPPAAERFQQATAVADATAPEPEPEPQPRSANYPEGRMSLGGTQSTSDEPTWWDEVLRFLRGE